MKLLKKIAVLALAGVLACGFIGCNKVTTVTDDRGVTVEGNKVYVGDYKEKSIIKVDFFDVGYGKDWIYEQAKDFVYENQEYALYLNSDSSLVTNLEQKITAGKNLSDLYIAPEASWETFAVQDLLVPLDEVYEAKPDGEDGKTVADKMLDEYEQATTFDNKGETHHYVMPWTQMVTGIAYNADMFAEYGIEVPKTMSQFQAACETIIEKSGGSVAPFVVPGKINGYFDFLGMNWWIQKVGLDGIKEFFAYDTVEVFNPDKEPYSGFKRALEEFDKYFGNSEDKFGKYVLSGSMAKDAYTAQADFINGRAAMIINANWLENEMGSLVESKNFNMKLMKVPTLDEVTEDPMVNYACAGFDFMCIPKESQNPEGAKAFLIFMCKDEQLLDFTRVTGTVRPFDYDYESLYDELSGFEQSVMDILTNSSCTYFDNPTGPRRYKAQKNLTQIPYMSIVSGSTPDAICKAEYEEAKIRWDNEWAI